MLSLLDLLSVLLATALHTRSNHIRYNQPNAWPYMMSRLLATVLSGLCPTKSISAFVRNSNGREKKWAFKILEKQCFQLPAPSRSVDYYKISQRHSVSVIPTKLTQGYLREYSEHFVLEKSEDS